MVNYLTELYNTDRNLWLAEIKRIGKLLYGDTYEKFSSIHDKKNDKWYILHDDEDDEK